MPDFDRRGFLQVLGAAGLAPLLPALPARAAVAVPVGASHSKALWSGIYAKSGSVPKFVNIAQNMGLSNTAIQGVGARSVGVRMAVAAAANPVARGAGPGKAAAPFRSERRKAMRDLERFVLDEHEDGSGADGSAEDGGAEKGGDTLGEPQAADTLRDQKTLRDMSETRAD